MMRTRRTIMAFLFTLSGFASLAGSAAAGPEWCDDGSPPPNDFRFRKTGSPSATSRTDWLKSTTGGTLNLSTGVNTLTGGVARGMNTAIAHAPSQDAKGKPAKDVKPPKDVKPGK